MDDSVAEEVEETGPVGQGIGMLLLLADDGHALCQGNWGMSRNKLFASVDKEMANHHQRNTTDYNLV